MRLVRLTVAFAVVALAGVGRSDVRAQELPEFPSRAAEKRALVAEGLGSLAAAAPLWWTATIGAGINYRAVTPTLSDHRNGILDHL